MKSRFLFLSILLISLSACRKNLSDSSIHSVLISKNGQVVEEAYFNNRTGGELDNVQSLTKGIMSLLIGIAIDKEYIASEDEPIAKYFPEEYRTLTDARKQKITIKHLLNQTSGLAWNGYLEHGVWSESEQPNAFVLNKELEYEAGETYNYNSGATHLLSVILSKTTGKSTLDFANEFLFNPLAINKIEWEKTKDGYYDGSGLGLSMQPKDLLQIGQLLINEGIFNGQQLLSKAWIVKSFDEAKKSKTRWGLRNSKHGYCWYSSILDGDKINYGMGYGGQFIIMIPNKKIVIITTHNHDTPDGLDQQIDFLNNKLPDWIAKERRTNKVPN